MSSVAATPATVLPLPPGPALTPSTPPVSFQLKCVVEYAKTNTSICEGCKSKILAESIRVGVVYTNGSLVSKDRLSWFHDIHYPNRLVKDIRKADGFYSLGTQDQTALLLMQDLLTQDKPPQAPKRRLGGTGAADAVDQAVDDAKQALVDLSKRKVDEILDTTDSEDEEDSGDDGDDSDDPDYEEDAKFVDTVAPPACGFIVPGATEPFVWVCTAWLSYYFERPNKKTWLPSDARQMRQSLSKTVKDYKFRDARSFVLDGDETKGAYKFVMGHLLSAGMCSGEKPGLKSITLYREQRVLQYISKNIDVIRRPNTKLATNCIVIPAGLVRTTTTQQTQLPQPTPVVQLPAPVANQTQLQQSTPAVQPLAPPTAHPIPTPPQAKPVEMVVENTPTKPNSIKVDVPLGISMVFHQSCCKATRVVVDIDEKTDFKNIFHTMRTASCSNCGDKMCHFCRGDKENCKECYKFIAELQKRKKRNIDNNAKEVQSLSLASTALPVPAPAPATAPVTEEKK